MNHFEGRLASQTPISYFHCQNVEEAEDFVIEHPNQVALVIQRGVLVSTFFGDECK